VPASQEIRHHPQIAGEKHGTLKKGRHAVSEGKENNRIAREVLKGNKGSPFIKMRSAKKRTTRAKEGRRRKGALVEA